MREKGFSLPLLLAVFVILIVVAGGAYYLGTTKNRLQTQNPAVTSVPSPTQDETVNWKTYTNTIAGYKIKYPPFLNVTERDLGGNYRRTVISDMELAESAVFPFGDEILVASTGDQAGLITPEIYKGFLLGIRWAESSISPEGLSKWEKLNING